MIIFKRNNIPIFVLFIFLFLIIFTFKFYVNKQQQYEQLSNNLYTSNSAMVLTKGDVTWIHEDSFGKSEYRIFLEENNTFRYLLKNNGDWSPPLISGSFFNHSEHAKAAVIGQEMDKLAFINNGIKYISYQNQYYEVKGIMGAVFPSSIDYLILLNDPDLQLNPKSRNIVVDSSSKNVVKKVLSSFMKSDSSITLINNFHKGLLRAGDAPALYKFLVIEMYVLLLIGIISITRYWYDKEQQVISILNMLGIASKNIYVELLFNYFVIVLISSLISLLLFTGAGIFRSFALSETLLLLIVVNSISWIVTVIFIGKDYMKKKRRW